MASRRILGKSQHYSSILLLCGLAAVFSALISGCVATKKTVPSVVTKAAKKKAKKKKNRNKNKKKKTFAKVLNANRSLLSDAYAAPKNKIPAFLKESSGTRYVPNPRRGYRIQILSTRNADKADRVAKHFRLWADSVMVIYIPETYVRFKQPFYKVQVGDFQFYNRAQKLTHLLKRRYPGAWVVHDEIIPELVPPDTVTFKFKKGG